jgi:Uma2 family endonuclease
MATFPNASGSHAASQGAVLPLHMSPLLPLENGDRLARIEFERRYDAMPELKKAELIDGVVYMGSPVRTTHGGPHMAMATWLGVYGAHTPGVTVYDNATVRLDDENEPQPDLALLMSAPLGGQARIDEDEYISGPPELVVEIAASSASRDLHSKREVYRRFGVGEYVVWRVYENVIDWFVLRNGQYEPLPPDTVGLLRSAQFPGLALDTVALLQQDMKGVLHRLHEAIKSDAHGSFVKQFHEQASSANPKP